MSSITIQGNVDGEDLLDAFNSLTVSGGGSDNDEKEAEIGLGKLSVDSDFSVGNVNSPVTLVYDIRMMLHVAIWPRLSLN